MNASKDSVHRTDVEKTSTTKVILKMNIGGNTATLNQTTTTTLETWVGLSKTDAETLVTSSSNCQSAKVTYSGGGVTLWNMVDNAVGTTTSSKMARMSDTNLWSV